MVVLLEIMIDTYLKTLATLSVALTVEVAYFWIALLLSGYAVVAVVPYPAAPVAVPVPVPVVPVIPVGVPDIHVRTSKYAAPLSMDGYAAVNWYNPINRRK